MNRIVRDIVESRAPFRLDVPRDGRRSPEALLAYTERDLDDAVRQATQHAREIASQEAEAMVRRLDRSVENALGAITLSLEGLETARQNLLDVVSAEILELAFQVAEAVVGSEIERRPESVETVVTQLLQELRDADRITVRLSPPTLQSLRERGGAISDDRVQWVADAGMGPGDARVDSDRGDWDATVETRSRRIRDAMRSARIDQVKAVVRAEQKPGGADDIPGSGKAAA